MNKLFLVTGLAAAVVAMLSTPLATAHAEGGAIAAALAHQDRPEADRARDAGRKPADVLAYFGIESGMRVMEVGASTGYYTEILSRVVGAEGHVLAQNSFGVMGFLKREGWRDALIARYAGGRLGNVEMPFSNIPNLDTPDGSLDAVLIVLIYHHMHYKSESGEALPETTRAALAKIRDMLKPGGVLGIVEHRAPDGDTREASNKRHRADLETTKADAVSAGLEFAGASEILYNADDSREQAHFENPDLKGKTDRFVLKFRKPAEG